MLNHAPDRAAAIKNHMIAVREKNNITLTNIMFTLHLVRLAGGGKENVEP